MKAKKIKRETIEPILSQKIKNIYKNLLGQDLENITYHQGTRSLVIILQGTVTSLEKFLYGNNREFIAKKLRVAIDDILLQEIKEIIEQIIKVEVIDFLWDTKIDSNFTGAIVIFDVHSQEN